MNDPVKLPVYIAIWAMMHAALGTMLTLAGFVFSVVMVPIMWCVVRQWKYRNGMQLDILREACLVVFFMIYVTAIMQSTVLLQISFDFGFDFWIGGLQLEPLRVSGVELLFSFIRLIIICVIGVIAAKWQENKAGGKFGMLPLSQFLLVAAIVFAAWLLSSILRWLGYPESDLSTYAMVCALPLIVVCSQRFFWPEKSALSHSLDGFIFVNLILYSLIFPPGVKVRFTMKTFDLLEPMLAICAIILLHFSFSKAKSLYHAHHHRRNKSSTR